MRDSQGSGLTTARALGLTVYTPSLGPELWLGPESVPRLGGLLCTLRYGSLKILAVDSTQQYRKLKLP